MTLEKIEYVIGVLCAHDIEQRAVRHALLRQVRADGVTLVDARHVLVRRALSE